MKATEFFVSRPRLAAVVAIAVLLVGAMAAVRLPVALYPTLARPAISVSCSYPGANAVEVMNTVAGPLEEKVNGVEGMDRMTSSCHDTGSYSLTVNFAVGYDRDIALMKVQSKVQQAMSLLPQEVKNTGVTVESGTTEELGILTLRSAGGRLPRDKVADYVFGVVNPAILRVPGVGKSVVKDDKLAVRVWMKPDRLAALGLSTDDVVAAIKAQNVQASLGSVGSRPTGDATTRVVTLISKGRLSSPEEFGNIVVATDAKGGLVRLGDVADIGMGPQGYSYSALYEETPAVYVAIYLLPGANPLETMAEVKAELRKLEPFFPADLAWDMTYDTTDYMRKALRGVALAIAVAVLLVFVALWVALRSLSGALVATLSSLVPASLAAAALLATGFQVNLLTLYAFLASLAFAAGMAAWTVALVRKGRLPGAEQVAAAALVVCAAFPLAFVDGVQGVLFRQFSVVFAAMSAASAFNSLLLVPVAASRLASRQAAGGGSIRAPATGGRASSPVAALLCLLFAALAGLAAYSLFARLPREFVPDEDMGVLYVDCKTAEGTPMETTSEIMRRIYREARSLGGIEKCATLLGESIINGSGENQSKMLLVLKDWSERGKGESLYEISRRVQAVADDIPGAEVFVLRMPPVKGMGSQGGVSVLFQSIGDNDPVKFSREVLRMRGELAKSPLVETVTGGFYTDTPHLRVVIDRAKCELMKVPMSSIYTVLQHNLGSIYVNDVNLGTQVNRVTAMADWRGRARPDDVRRLYVRSKAGAMVPLDTLVTCREELGPRSCYRCDQYLYCTEQFIPKPGVSTSEAVAEVRRICREKLSPGFLNDWAGFTYESLKSRGDEGLLFGLSILLVYLVLVAFLESWREAFWRLLPGVTAVFGAILALTAAGVAFSAYSRYALAVLVASTAAMSLVTGRTPGFRARAALPLLAALAMLPLVFATGAGSAGSRSLGVTLFGGYAAYALLSLALSPESGIMVRHMNTKTTLMLSALALSLAANAAVETVSPADGATVALLTEQQKKIMSFATYDERVAVLRADHDKPHDERYYCGDSASKWRLAIPLKLKWRTTEDESGPWLIRLGTSPDLADATDVWLSPEEAAKMAMSNDPQTKEESDGKTRVYTYEMPRANLELGRTYYWRVWSNVKCPNYSHGSTVEAKCPCGKGRQAVPSAIASFTAEDQPPRWIRLDGHVKNVRDLGGWRTTDGRRVRQGMIFRGSGLDTGSVNGVRPGRNKLTVEDVAYMKEVLGIRTDLDLRTKREISTMEKSPLGDGVAFVSCPLSGYAGLFVNAGFNKDLCPDAKGAMARIFRLFCDRASYPVYFHCAGGADRTGTLAFVLNGVLGVPEHDLDVDWEATFYPRLPEVTNRHMSKDEWRQERHFHEGFAAYGDADTPMRRRIELYLLECGVTQDEIERFRSIMLER